MQTDAIDALTEIETSIPDPLHEVRDRTKVDALTASLTEHGWQGAPILVDGDQAITGAHRIAAVVRLRNSEGIQVRIPRVQVRDLCDQHGVSWDDLLAEHGTGQGVDTYEAAVHLADVLPAATVDYLGLDAH